MSKIKVVDVDEVLDVPEIIYNESLQRIENDDPPFDYWPVIKY